MLTAEENELLTRIGPATRMGALLRRYWHPVAGSAEMEDRWTMKVRLLGEDLVLFKDRTGKLGLIEESCPHRRVSLALGIPTETGIRCAYHGWEFDGSGRCTDQPSEPERNALRNKVITTAYPVEEMGGLIWAYLGPAPAPLLPRFDGFVVPGSIRMVGKVVVPCNWVQIMENSVDPVHTEWLHGKLLEFVHEKDNVKFALSRHHVKIAFDEFEFGIVKRRLMEGQPEDCDDWTVGHPILFPTMLAVGSGGGLWQHYAFQIRVPIDDTNTMHYWYHAYVPPEGAAVPQHLLDRAPVYEPPIRDAQGNYRVDYVDVQDIAAWVTQGAIADRSKERLGATDQGVQMYRRMLRRELDKVEQGQDPIGVIRDPARNEFIALPLEKNKDMFSDGFKTITRRNVTSFAPIAEELLEVFAQEPPASKKRRETVPAE
ncbi:MAG: rieske (2Fe-2S) domain protein [Rhodospirillales bacterium]|nr:rieske (2Fe-2S) domain protein [Rhodospirillales bacterium]